MVGYFPPPPFNPIIGLCRYFTKENYIIHSNYCRVHEISVQESETEIKSMKWFMLIILSQLDNVFSSGYQGIGNSLDS